VQYETTIKQEITQCQNLPLITRYITKAIQRRAVAYISKNTETL